MMDQISVLILATPPQWELARYTINNLIDKSAYRLSISVYFLLGENYNFNDVDRSRNIFADQPLKRHSIVVTTANKETVINEFYSQKCKSKYKCVLPVNILVNKGWDMALVDAHQNFVNAGILGIRTSDEQSEIGSVLYNDIRHPEPVFKSVWLAPYNLIIGLIFSTSEILSKIKLSFTEKSNTEGGFEELETSYIAQRMGLRNFYITEQSCFRYKVDDSLGPPTPSPQRAAKFMAYIQEIQNIHHGRENTTIH